jgi:hypothetical protein
VEFRYNLPLTERMTAEALRIVEESGQHLPASVQVEQAISQSHATVEQRILERAKLLAPDAGINHSLQRVQHLAKLLSYTFIGLFALLGALASLQAFSHNNAQVNFYWLLLILLGLNLVSLTVWAVGMWTGSRQGGQPLLARSSVYLVNRWINKRSGANSTDAHTARAWFSVMLSGANGRWNLSCLSHLLWSAYLLGGLLMIFLLFSARQYNFVWETTLLQESSFVWFTQCLAILPEHLGWTTPTLEQITSSRLGADGALLAEARQNWASLLVASLLLYGIVPRLILLALCALARAHTLSTYRLLLSRPYYVRLRQRLLPQTTALGVVDPDEGSPLISPASRPHPDGQPIPADAFWVAIEWDPDEHWPLPGIAQKFDLGCVNDRDSQHATLARLPSLGNHPLVIAVSLQRSPDRGLARIVGKLRETHRRDSWLVLLESAHNKLENPLRDARLCDWYALADNCGIDANHITQRAIATKSTDNTR